MSNKKSVAAGILFLLLFCVESVFAQTSQNSQNSESSIQIQETEQSASYGIPDESSIALAQSASDSGSQGRSLGVFFFLRMLFVLAIVIGCVYAALYFMRRSMRIPESDDKFLRVTASVPVGAGKSVQVVTLIDHAYIVGVAENSVNLIAEVSDKELIDAMNLYADGQKNTRKPRNFSDILEIFMPNGPKENGGVFSDTAKNASELLRKQREKLNGGE